MYLVSEKAAEWYETAGVFDFHPNTNLGVVNFQKMERINIERAVEQDGMGKTTLADGTESAGYTAATVAILVFCFLSIAGLLSPSTIVATMLSPSTIVATMHSPLRLLRWLRSNCKIRDKVSLHILLLALLVVLLLLLLVVVLPPSAACCRDESVTCSTTSRHHPPAASLLPPGPAPGGLEELEQWLVSIHPVFVSFAAALRDYGYEDINFMRQVDEEDFEDALTEVGMIKPGHRALAIRHFRQLITSPEPHGIP
jgi:hypothetical protein